jgi:hypothetical protein
VHAQPDAIAVTEPDSDTDSGLDGNTNSITYADPIRLAYAIPESGHTDSDPDADSGAGREL